jgi:uncharacterized protein YecE (DUF72 family)
MVRTARDFVYLRLRRGSYPESAIGSWAERIGAVLEDGTDAYVYLKHEDDPSGVRYALRIRDLLD